MDNKNTLRACIIVYNGSELCAESRNKILAEIIRDCGAESGDIFTLDHNDIAQSFINKIKFDTNINENIIPDAISTIVNHYYELITTRNYSILTLEILRDIKNRKITKIKDACKVIIKNKQESATAITNLFDLDRVEVINVIERVMNYLKVI